jgi:ribosomal protein S18 acetylase RimI-like enzyme
MVSPDTVPPTTNTESLGHGIQVRLFQPHDLPAITDLYQEPYEDPRFNELQSARPHSGKPSGHVLIEEVPGEYLASGGAFVVAVKNGKIVGMGGLKRITEATGHLTHIKVADGQRRSGIGSQILEDLERRADQMGIRELTAETSRTFLGAQRLFEKHGFKKTVEGEVQMGPIIIEVIRYSKSVSQNTSSSVTSFK